jgi:hypothetical protein
MQRSLLFILLIAVSCWGCKKFEASYTVLCEYNASLATQWLVMTNSKGKIIDFEQLETGSASFRGEFTTHDNDAPDSFDLHLIYHDSISGYYRVFSSLGVYNGTLVSFNPLPESFPNFREVHFNIAGIESVGNLDVFEGAASNLFYAYDFDGQLIRASCLVEAGEGLVLRLKANSETQFRSLYIPDHLLSEQDTLLVQWTDFKPPTNLHSVQFTAGPNPSIIQIEAVSPDFKHFVTLHYQIGNIPSLNTEFNRPEGVPADWVYRVFGLQKGVLVDRIFQGTEELKFGVLDDRIQTIEVSEGQILLELNHDFDMVQLNSNAIQDPSNQNNQLFWTLTGKPSSMLEYKIPELEKFLPDWAWSSNLFKQGLVRAANYNQHDYDQIQSGFPHRLKERFAFAKSGFRELWENY